MPDDPALWELEFLWKQKMDIVMAEHFPGNSDTSITVKTDITKSLARQKDTVTVEGSVRVALDQSPDVSITYVPRDCSTVIEFTPSRRFDTGLPELRGDDDPSSDQPADSFRVKSQFQIPANIKVEYLDPQTGQPVTREVQCDMLVVWNRAEFYFPYKPGRQEIHEGEKDVGEYLAKAAGEMPPPMVLKDPTGSVKYTLKQKDLDIRLDKKGEDLTRYNDYRNNRQLTRNLCYYDKARSGEEESFHLHGNFFVQITADKKELVRLTGTGADSDFHIWRYARSWKAPVDPSGNPGAFVSGGWLKDNTGPGNSDWIDVPGADSSATKRPGKWLPSYTLVEFLVSVDKYPEFGILHFVHVMYTQPGKYFVRVLDFGKVGVVRAKEIYDMQGHPWCESTGNGVPFPGPKDWVPVKDPPLKFT